MGWIDKLCYEELKALREQVEERMSVVRLNMIATISPDGTKTKVTPNGTKVTVGPRIPVKPLPVHDNSVPARKTVHRCYEGPTLFELAEAQARDKDKDLKWEPNKKT